MGGEGHGTASMDMIARLSVPVTTMHPHMAGTQLGVVGYQRLTCLLTSLPDGDIPAHTRRHVTHDSVERTLHTRPSTKLLQHLGAPDSACVNQGLSMVGAPCVVAAQGRVKWAANTWNDQQEHRGATLAKHHHVYSHASAKRASFKHNCTRTSPATDGLCA